MKRLLAAALIAAIAIVAAPIQHESTAQDITITIKEKPDKKPTTPPFSGDRAAVDVAVLLDTSNSMDGLIGQAKSQLWKIVQQFADAEKAGKTPILRVAVFEYGNSRLPAAEGYIRQVVQLTDDLDKVSEALFSLTTNGGDEYCGMVIDESLTRLDWSKEPNSYKAIFIAGNEPFTQGSVDYRKACKRAIELGVVVNTIHCGAYQAGISGKWKDGADLAEGKYMNINQDRKVVHIDCPQDKIIIRLNDDLNKTYLWFGQEAIRKGYEKNQYVQDANAFEAAGAGAGGRVQTKAGALYRNVGRDLIDSLEADKDILKKVKVQELPKEMQTMTDADRIAHVQAMAAKRAEIKKKIAELSVQREAFLVEKRKSMAEESGDATLGDAISQTVRQQLQKSGFDLKDKK